MEHCLTEIPGEEKDMNIKRKNDVRRAIKNLFKDRTCHTFVRPVNEEKKLSRIEELNYNELRKEFQ